MSFADAKQEYSQALRQGKREYRMCVDQGKKPYPEVLDEILDRGTALPQESLGLVSIPLENIAGTRTGGRQNAFSASFLPLLEPNTEFAVKWCNLYESHMNEGIQEPIKAYEYMNRFYVQEGNKRVSVLSYCQAATIKADVIRLIPPREDTRESRIYYEFMDFYRLSQINYLYFSREFSFRQLQTAVCKGAQERWTNDDRSNFFYFYTLFRREFYALGGERLPLTVGDAILVYLRFHRYDDAQQQTPAQIRENLQKLWNEIAILSHSKTVQVSLEPSKPEKAPQPLFQSLFSRRPTRPTPLHVVFVLDRSPDVSSWAASHVLGKQDLDTAFGDQLATSCIYNAECGLYDEAEIEAAARGGADVIFATSSEMMPACLKVAARHPNVKILNCSLLQPHPLVRTYSARIYEAKYLLGVLAGIFTRSSQVGYIANYPLYGVCAAVNAFARGLQSVRPDAKVVLRWQCDPQGKPLDFSDCPDITVFSGRDQKDPHPRSQSGYHYGLCRRKEDGTLEELAYPIWHWGSIYQHIIRSILEGMWDDDGGDTFRGVSYWWGMRAQAVEMRYAAPLPDASMHLLSLLTEQIRNCKYDPFVGRITDNTGRLVKDDDGSFSPEEIIHMNWLNENVIGEIPVLKDPSPELRPLLEQQGITPAAGKEV